MGLEWVGDVGPFAGMVMVILAQVSNMVVVKAAMSQGMDKYVIVVYSGFLACLLCFLGSIIFHRSASSRPPLTSNVICGFILISFFGVSGQICGFAGIQYSSPTLGTAVMNIIPAFTFILAIIFRMEKLDWRSSSSQAKLVGTIVSVGGAFTVTFYNGPTVVKTYISSSLQLASQQSDWILGGLLLATEAFLVSAVYTVQGLVLKKYMAPLLMSFYIFSFGTILSIIYSLIAVNDSSAWRLRLDMGLIAIVYTAMVLTFTFNLGMWCLWKRGPLFVSMFKPLGIIFGAAMSVVFLGDVLYLGSVIGSVIIVIGFYVYMWGKAKEKDLETENIGVQSLASSSNSVPLLQNKINDI